MATTMASTFAKRIRVSAKARSTSITLPASAEIVSASGTSDLSRDSESGLRATAATFQPSAAKCREIARPRLRAPKTSSVGMWRSYPHGSDREGVPRIPTNSDRPVGGNQRSPGVDGTTRPANFSRFYPLRRRRRLAPRPARAPPEGLYCRPHADVAQLARASACHAEGRGFESLHPLLEEAPLSGAFAYRSERLAGCHGVGVATQLERPHTPGR